jgi:hypothetical protein
LTANWIELFDDVGDGLCGETGQPGDAGAADGAMGAHDLKHHTPIVGAAAFGIIADRNALAPGLSLAGRHAPHPSGEVTMRNRFE